ncbi:MAG TPA: cupin domain-containing protein [Gaiellales bacterium]|jgi:mannose-6-phosphate isomerase-like protein (cupin superfamily)
MPTDAIDLADKLTLIDEHWKPGIVATYNDNKVVLVKVFGEFVWHAHADTDDLFLVISGRLLMDLRDRTVEIGPGELLVVPKGVEHRPRALEETSLLLIEPLGTQNTGDDGADAELAAEERWI